MAGSHDADDFVNREAQEEVKNQELPEYYHQLLEDLLSKLDPKKVSELLSHGEDVMSMSLENFSEKACSEGQKTSSGQENSGLPHEASKQENSGLPHEASGEEYEDGGETGFIRKTAEQLLSQAGEEIRFLKSLEQPATMENLNSMMELWKGNNGFYQKLFSGKLPEKETKELRSLADAIFDRMDGEEDVDRSVQKFTEFAEEKLNEQYSAENLTSLDVRTLSHMNYTLQLVGKLARERHYEIPMVFDEEIVNVSLTIMPAANRGGKVHISIADKMEAELVTEKETIRGYLMCADSGLASAMKEKEEQLISGFKAMGYEQTNIGFGTLGADRTRFIGTSEGEQTETKNLYQIAKQTIHFVREISA